MLISSDDYQSLNFCFFQGKRKEKHLTLLMKIGEGPATIFVIRLDTTLLLYYGIYIVL